MAATVDRPDPLLADRPDGRPPVLTDKSVPGSVLTDKPDGTPPVLADKPVPVLVRPDKPVDGRPPVPLVPTDTPGPVPAGKPAFVPVLASRPDETLPVTLDTPDPVLADRWSSARTDKPVPERPASDRVRANKPAPGRPEPVLVRAHRPMAEQPAAEPVGANRREPRAGRALLALVPPSPTLAPRLGVPRGC